MSVSSAGASHRHACMACRERSQSVPSRTSPFTEIRTTSGMCDTMCAITEHTHNMSSRLTAQPLRVRNLLRHYHSCFSMCPGCLATCLRPQDYRHARLFGGLHAR